MYFFLMYAHKSFFKYIGNRPCEQFLCSLTHSEKWERDLGLTLLLSLQVHLFLNQQTKLLLYLF